MMKSFSMGSNRHLPRNLAVAALLGLASPARATQVVIDVTDYMAQATGGQAICTDGDVQCVHGYPNQSGEITLYYAEQGRPVVVDYIARSYGGGANGGSYTGVSRSLDNVNGLRCFSDPGQPCTAPPSTSSMPEGLPKSLLLNVVSEADDVNASAADGTPVAQIAGSVNVTGLTSFQINVMNTSTCQQTVIGTVPVSVFAAYLYQFPFGNDVGTQNALVVEEVEYEYYNGQLEPGHIERYYYVSNFGRVRDSVAFYDHVNKVYTDRGPNGELIGSNPIRNHLRPVSILPPEPANSCPQGTRPFSE